MKAISEFVVHASELLEAEGRTLRAVVRGEGHRLHAVGLTLAMAAVVLLMAIPLALSGLWLIGAGLMWWLESEMSRPLAAGITGLAALCVAGALVGCGAVLARKRVP